MYVYIYISNIHTIINIIIERTNALVPPTPLKGEVRRGQGRANKANLQECSNAL